MSKSLKKIILASASPQRLELLKTAGVVLTVWPSEVDEEPLVSTDVAETAWLRAKAKAEEVAKLFPDALVIGADTVVEGRSGNLLSKPETIEEASKMFRSLIGTRHRVISAACLLMSGKKERIVEEAWVTLTTLEEEEIEDYLATRESLGKAGGLCVQGIGKKFVEKIEGEEAVVVGLPLEKILNFLEHTM